MHGRSRAADALRHLARIKHRAEAPVRRRVDHFAGMLAENPVLRLSEFEGSFELLPQSDIFRRVAISGEYEPELAACIVDRLDPERDAIDVGANVGFYSVLMARHMTSGRVLAIEPDPTARLLLEANLQRNGVAERVIVFAGAAGDEQGVDLLQSVEGRPEYSSLGSLVHPAVVDSKGSELKVELQRLDDLVLAHSLDPALVKLDIEGAEHRALIGADSTIRKCRPALLLEISDLLLRAQGSSSKALGEFIQSYNYSLLNPVRPTHPMTDSHFGEVLAVPQTL